MVIKLKVWTPEEYAAVRRSHYWNLAISALRFNPFCWFFKGYEKQILASVRSVLNPDENAALDFQIRRLDGIDSYHKGRFHTIFIDQRKFVPIIDAPGELPLATLKIRQGKQRMTVIVEQSRGALYSISFRPGKFKERESFEILSVVRGGKASRTAESIDRYAHGRDPEEDTASAPDQRT